ncbi:autotransporter outer membrane beta-barrel domain-containing protein [Xenorhabdus bovienii]|uniref:autotransporter outer membrane beta-barrel domain-containing protein n=1 Tax=Xenorhabdus bovienii TaxID=40576 RepID=UPI00237C5848|nr:autotransporter outer membrane beta-barrel domain-containing protein [Xenorhabdus bovienii]MDE1491234.1 autotransporter outer membrane beta-barrel domain-containing protein [Xenorhabdus bovienii]
MKIYRHAVLPALLFSGISVDAIAESSCGSSNTNTTISRNETAPCNLSQSENLTINASIDAPIGQANEFDHYGLKYSAVNIGTNNNQAQVISVDNIENNGILQGTAGVTVTYSGSVGKLRNHGTISGTNGTVWVSGHMNMLDNYGSINSSTDTTSLNAIQIQPASGSDDNSQYGRIDTILNQKGGAIDGISSVTSTLKHLHNFGTLKSQKNNSLSTLATFVIDAGSNVGIFNNDGTVIGPNHGILIQNGGYLEKLYNHSGSKGFTAEQDAIQVTGQGMALLDVNPHIRPSKIKQITNASLLYGKRNGIYIDDKGVVDTITNQDSGEIKGDKFAIDNAGTISDGIYNSGSITGKVALGSAKLFMSGPKAILDGDVTGIKGSVVTIDGSGTKTKNYTHHMSVEAVTLLLGSEFYLGDGGRIFSDITNNDGTLYFNQSGKTAYNHIISGTGNVHQTGIGTTILTGKNAYTGETNIESGTLQLGNNGTTGSIDNKSKVTIGNNGILAFSRTDPTIFDNEIDGNGSVYHRGTGDLILTDNVKTGKPITVTTGKLQFGDGAKIGKLSLAGIDNNGAVIVAGKKDSVVTLDGEISGTGSLEVKGGTATLTSNNTYSGKTTIDKDATLQLGNGGKSGNLAKGGVLNNGILAFNLSDLNTFESAISGNGLIEKTETGTTTLSADSSAFTGTTNVEGGMFSINGKLGDKTSKLTVKKGGAVSGTGTIGGTTTIKAGGHLAGTGQQGDILTFDNDLTLEPDANVNISLGSEEASGLFTVHGDLTLAGTLNVKELGGFAAGEYDIFNYDRKLNNNGMTITGDNSGSLSLDTHNPNQVHLTNTGGLTLNWWAGGNGIWQVDGDQNWTSKSGDMKSSWRNTDQFPIFAKKAGTVRVNNSGGVVTVNGMQFRTDGYVITGEPLTLVTDSTRSAKIRVGAGNKSSAGMVATIASPLIGTAMLEKWDEGTLILAAKNGYTGGTKVTRGTLQIGNSGTEGDIIGGVEIGRNGSLAFYRSDDMAFADKITGEGNLVKKGKNKLTLTGVNIYTGTTAVQQGTLYQGAAGAFSGASSFINEKGSTLDLGGFNTTFSALNNSGTVIFGRDDNAVGRTLTVTDDYTGNHGTISLSTVFAGDNSTTDKLVVKGNASGTTQLAIKNTGGKGALTKEGIKVVEVKSTSNASFNLAGDYHHQGDPVIVTGAYAYRLDKHGKDWYLISSLKNSKPTQPHHPPAQLYHAGVSLYEAYGSILQTLNKPTSLRDRIAGHESRLSDVADLNTIIANKHEANLPSPLPTGVWGQIIGSYGKLSPRVTTSGADNITYKMRRAQVGIDSRLYENTQGAVVGGVFLQYSNIDADVGSEHGKGNIRANGYAAGGTGTWYGNNGFYLDGLAQLSYFDNDLYSKTANQHLGENKFALGYTLSLESGRRIDLTPSWSLTPQAQLTYSSINMRDFEDKFGSQINFDRSQNMTLRVGTTVDYRQKWRDSQSKKEKVSNLYGLFNLSQELLGRSDSVGVADVSFHGSNERFWGEIGAGGSYSWNEGKYFVYSQVSANTSLNNFADSYELNAKIGIKATW